MVFGLIRGMTRSMHPRRNLPRWLGAATVAILSILVVLGWSPNAAAETETQLVGFGQPMRVEADERVDTVVTIGADLTVLGEVEGDAIVVGGTLELGPRAVVGGDAVAVGGSILAPDTATIQGDRIEVSGTTWGPDERDERETVRMGPFMSSLAAFVQVFAAFLLSALILAFAPRRVRSVADHMRARPGLAVLFGCAIVLLFIPLLGALTISIVGIPLIPVAFMLLAAIVVFGMTALGLRLGYLMPFYSEERSAMGALAIGYVVLGVVALIPWVGAIVIPLTGLFAAGAVLLSWFGQRPAAPAPETT